ncbi:hypothetical protein CROQUDRAFT_92758 [Cronartium quercuum f. sp. fusiforme G11]|uniref:Uncharacterized protein n=1 Tax=Cronartium quercuum f. sp. fusiforme G11 TaxID=708437 RepID=A0A9P6NLR0_9BASI|nr:hypothetical protein CROQUDRAFT_92758 [Cronartium quercuum f. sp. fusiforme G11]
MHKLKVNDIEALQGFKNIGFNIANELDPIEEEDGNSAIPQVKDTGAVSVVYTIVDPSQKEAEAEV